MYKMYQIRENIVLPKIFILELWKLHFFVQTFTVFKKDQEKGGSNGWSSY